MQGVAEKVSPGIPWPALEPPQRGRSAHEACLAQDCVALCSLVEAHLRQDRPGSYVSPHTLRSYGRSIQILLDRWSREMVLHPSQEAAAHLVQELEEASLAPSTVKVYVAGMRALYAALQWAGVVDADPFADIHPPKVPVERLENRQAYSPAELHALLALAGPVDRAVILLCADDGIRISDCVALTWPDVELATGRLVIRRDSGEARHTVVLSRSQVDALRALPRGDGDGVLGFTTDTRVRQRIRRLCERAGVPYRGVHALRYGAEGAADVAPRRLPSLRDSTENRIGGGVASYRAFREELSRTVSLAGRSGRACGLLMMDLDRLPEIEATHGHEIGEAIVSAVAGRIDNIRRPYDFVARIDGGTFGVILMNVASGAVLEGVAHRFASAIRSDPVGVRGKTVPVGVTVGAASDADDPDRLVHQAREALRRARDEGLDAFVTA